MDGVHENGRKWIAIGNLLDSGDLKMTNLTISVTSTQLDAKDSFKINSITFAEYHKKKTLPKTPNCI